MITWPSDSIIIERDWPNFKKVLDGSEKILRLQSEEDAKSYQLFAVDGIVIYYIIIYKASFEPLGWTPQQINDNTAARDEYLITWVATANKRVTPLIDDRDRLDVAQQPRIGKEVMFVTHDFCDPTTWYTNSIRITNEAATDEDGFNWSLVNQNVIDMIHGKIYNEDYFSSLVPHQYAVEVRVNSVVQTMRAPFSSSGGDYTLNYRTGVITFAVDQTGNDVRVDYSHATDSIWYVAPSADEIFDLEHSEAQFADDLDMLDAVLFKVQGWIIAFSPSNAASNGGPYPDDTLIDLLVVNFKTMANLIDEAVGVYPTIPSIGGSVRGTAQTMHGFPFRHNTVRSLIGNAGMRFVVQLQNHNALGGYRATATLYGSMRTGSV